LKTSWIKIEHPEAQEQVKKHWKEKTSGFRTLETYMGKPAIREHGRIISIKYNKEGMFAEVED